MGARGEPRWLRGYVETFFQQIRSQRAAGGRERVGATPGTARFNSKIWVGLSRVMRCISTEQSRNMAPFSVKVFNGTLGDEETLYLKVLNHHCYVILFISERNICVVADESNAFISDKSIQRQLGAICPTMISCRFPLQSGVDRRLS